MSATSSPPMLTGGSRGWMPEWVVHFWLSIFFLSLSFLLLLLLNFSKSPTISLPPVCLNTNGRDWQVLRSQRETEVFLHLSPSRSGSTPPPTSTATLFSWSCSTRPATRPSTRLMSLSSSLAVPLPPAGATSRFVGRIAANSRPSRSLGGSLVLEDALAGSSTTAKAVSSPSTTVALILLAAASWSLRFPLSLETPTGHVIVHPPPEHQVCWLFPLFLGSFFFFFSPPQRLRSFFFFLGTVFHGSHLPSSCQRLCWNWQ